MWAIDRRTRWFVAFSACIGACAFFAILWITAGGIGVSPDSTIYIDTAQNLLAGNGFVARGAPMTHYPPLYPILLAVSGSFGSDILESARYLNALLFAANVILCSVAVWLATERSLCAAALTGLWVMVSYGIVQPHAMVLSEPPFMVFVLIALVALTVFIGKQRGHWLYLASVAIGLAMLTRYVGAAFVPVLFALPLLQGGERFFAKVRSAAVAGFIACVPLASWLLYNLSRAETATNRVLAFHPPGVPFARTIIANTSYFLLPVWEIPLWFKAFLFAVALTAAVLAVLRLYKETFLSDEPVGVDTALPLVAVLFSAAYFAFLVVSISLFDAGTAREGQRIFFPVFLSMALASISVAWSQSREVGRSVLWWGFIGVVFVSVLANASRSVLFAADARKNGLGYNSVSWRNSSAIAAVKAFPESVDIYTNGHDVIPFLTGRKATMLPATYSGGTAQASREYRERLRAVCEAVADSGAAIVYFDAIDWRDYLPTREDLEVRCPLPVLARFKDGIIYGNPALGQMLHAPNPTR